MSLSKFGVRLPDTSDIININSSIIPVNIFFMIVAYLIAGDGIEYISSCIFIEKSLL